MALRIRFRSSLKKRLYALRGLLGQSFGFLRRLLVSFLVAFGFAAGVWVWVRAMAAIPAATAPAPAADGLGLVLRLDGAWRIFFFLSVEDGNGKTLGALDPFQPPLSPPPFPSWR